MRIVTMNRFVLHYILCITAFVGGIISPFAATAQTDSISRVVEVTREYQPIIEGAGKMDVLPQLPEAPTVNTDINFSDYATPLQNIDPTDIENLGFSPTNFLIPTTLNGFLRGGIGHSATLFDFNYTLNNNSFKQTSTRSSTGTTLNLNAHHLGQWGRKTLSHSSLGMDINHLFSSADLYFGVNAENIFFTRYGRYFHYTDIDKMKGEFSQKYSHFSHDSKQSQWEIDTRIGVRSLPNADIKYLVQTGYEPFILQQSTVEHTINTQAMFEWQTDMHQVGAELHIEDHLYSFDKTDPAFVAISTKDGYALDSSAYHAVKLQPYYAYSGNRFNIHLGVNLDMCVGRGKVFLPSPNVTFEAKLAPDWLALYGSAIGKYATSSSRQHYNKLRFLHAEREICTRANRSYTPVNATLGFKIRPVTSLLFDVYAGYQYTKYDIFFTPESVSDEPTGYFTLLSRPYQCWQIGARMHYHYQDIIFVSLDGHYNIWNMSMQENDNFNLPKNHIIDHETWAVNFRVDGKIDSKWSLYLVSHFSGGKYLFDMEQKAIEAKPIIDINLGGQYNINKWLSCYLQICNIINRKNDIVYGYQTQGINFIGGVTYAF